MPFFKLHASLTKSRFIICSLVICMAMLSGACTSSSVASLENTSLPELDFEDITPVQVSAAAVHVENNYEVGADNKDVSSSFPTPPDIVLRRYAEHRLAPSGDNGILKFVIEDAHIYHSYIEPKGMLGKWTRSGGKDRYDVSMSFRMYKQFPDGSEGPHKALTIERYMTIPESTSIAQREREQVAFLEMLMQDIDGAVIQNLQDTLEIPAFIQ